MPNSEIEEVMDRLVHRVQGHIRAYYVDNAPTISDLGFDKLYQELLDMEEQYPMFKHKNSPTDNVGHSVASDKAITHLSKMYSLNNTFTEAGMELWLEKSESLSDSDLDKEGVLYVGEPKFDGLSANLVYKKGRLISAATRGDGLIGEDILHNVKRLSIPLKIEDKHLPEILEIRGEIHMSFSGFVMINKIRESTGKDRYVNTRNAAAGVITSSDPLKAALKTLTFSPYGIGYVKGDRRLQSQQETLRYLFGLGFSMASKETSILTKNDVYKYCQQLEADRSKLNYGIDGAVIKLDRFHNQKLAKSTNKYPLWAIAYKFKEEEAKTTLLDVIFQVGKSGRVTPVAILDPIFVGGATLTTATLHNMVDIGRLGIQIGDMVKIKRGGDVIPKIFGISKKGKDRKPIKMVKRCPDCDTPVVKDGDTFYICPNTSGCPGQRARAILRYVHRDAMDIDGIGNIIAKYIVTMADYKSLADLYNPKVMGTIAGKTGKNIVSNLNSHKRPLLSKFLYSLGIHTFGRSLTRDLSLRYGSLDRIMSLSESDLLILPDIGPATAAAISGYFSDQQNRALIKDLLSTGIVPQPDTQLAIPTLDGHVYVITGTFKNINRREATKILTDRGARVSGSVSKNTTMLFAGDKAGSKLAKAKSIPIPIGTEDDLNTLLKGEV